MSTVIPFRRAQDAGEDLIEALTPEEKAAETLGKEFPQLCNDVAMLVRRPFRLHWDSASVTASTDCKAEIFISPHFFLEGRTDVGYGSVYHESGHILWSPDGTEVLEAANQIGGPVLRNIANIALDRKDDSLTASEAPGFAPTLRGRLKYICTMTRRRDLMARGFSELSADMLLRHVRPKDVYEDFFFAAKWHKRPRFKQVFKAMKYLSRKHLSGAGKMKLLWISQRVKEILGEPSSQEKDHFNGLSQLALSIGNRCGAKIDQKISAILSKMAKAYVGAQRHCGLSRLIEQLKSPGVIYPGPLSVGKHDKVALKKVNPEASNESKYTLHQSKVQLMIDPLVRKLRMLDNPSEFTLHGQDEGSLDLTEVARIATCLSGYHEETVVERDIDARIDLALDCSGSMTGEKLEVAKEIATVFTEAILSVNDLDGQVWGFSSNAVYDFGPVARNSGFVNLEGEAGNSDTHMLCYAGNSLAKSKRRRKVLLVLCDDGPDDIEEVKKISRQMLARGIITIHLLFGVHGTPDIYPFELVYSSHEECLDEFGDLLETIIGHIR